MVSKSGKMAVSTTDSGAMTKLMELESSSMQTETFMKGLGAMIKLMVTEHISMLMERLMLVSG